MMFKIGMLVAMLLGMGLIIYWTAKLLGYLRNCVDEHIFRHQRMKEVIREYRATYSWTKQPEFDTLPKEL